MGLREDLLDWSRASLPAWQQDALRRLFESDTLSPEAEEEVFKLLKWHHGLGDGDLSPSPFDVTHVPGGLGEQAVQIVGLENLANVNGFPDGRALSFAPMGLTVVFGGNGVGKSGYARVLKRACRARHVQPVRPNAFSESAAPPSADVIYTADGATKRCTWAEGSNSHPDLAHVSVYDSSCAADYIEDEGAPAYLPYGLSKLSALARTSESLERRIRAELATLQRDITRFSPLRGDTAVGRLIGALGESTDLELARALAAMSDAEKARTAEIKTALSESDPEPKARSLDNLAARIENLAAAAASAKTYVTDGAIDRLHQLVTNDVEAKKAHELAQAVLRGDNLLPGTGNEPWRRMFEAAKEFALTAYPDQPYPSPDAHCVLCQRQLDADSQRLLQSFTEFVAGSAARTATTDAAELSTALHRIQSVDLTLGIDPTLAAEIREFAPELDARLAEVTTSWSNQREWMQRAVSSGEWNDRPSASEVVQIDSLLRELAVQLRSTASQLRAAVDPAARAALEIELKELRARESLGAQLPALERYVEDAKTARRLNNCLGDLNTSGISRKLTSLTQTYVTDALVDAMREELGLLNYPKAARLRVNRRTERGFTLVRVALENTDVPAHQVLSEGEQRTTALAFFLAEMRLAPSASTLIFDDPVTSLDHRYRHAVARRLAAIARERQVIVLTHDSVFLMALHKASQDESYEPAYRTIEWNDGPGHVFDSLDWDNMPTKARIADLQSRHSRIEKAWGDQPSGEARKLVAEAYSDLRGTIERLIRDDLINRVVEPYTEGVNVEAFRAVIGIPEQDWTALIDVYDRACESTRAHDTSAEQQLEPPTSDQLRRDVGAIEQIRQRADQRRKTAIAVRDARIKDRRTLPGQTR